MNRAIQIVAVLAALASGPVLASEELDPTNGGNVPAGAEQVAASQSSAAPKAAKATAENPCGRSCACAHQGAGKGHEHSKS